MSLLGKIAVLALRAMRGKRDLADEAALRAAIVRRRLIDRHQPPKNFRTRYRLRIEDAGGHPCYTLASRASGEARILYLHGGCYTYEITSYHWDFLGKLVDTLGCTITIPIYPLAPEHHVAETFAILEPLAEALLGSDPQNLTIMGDSAGGGLALALAQRLAVEGKPQPGGIVLLSPWLDILLEDPAITALEASDPMLGRGGLVAAGRLWSRGLDPRDHRLSPLFGPLDGIAPITLFAGGREILLPDARRLRDRLEANQQRVTYFEYPEMFHVWPLVIVLPESKRAFEQIVAACHRRP